jgi:predicted MFS family arabinose efflux permease
VTNTEQAAPTVARRSALRNPAMRAIVVAETISTLGAQMTFLALPWFVLMTTGSATRMGIVFAVELLPVALLGIPSALLVQRLGVRSTMLLCDLLRAPLLALVPVLHLMGLLSFPVLLVVVFVAGACGAPYLSAQRLVIPEAFSDDEALVVQGNALIEGATRIAGLIGPAIAGALIVAVGPVNVIWVDAASFLVSFAVLFTWLPKPAVSLADAAVAGSRGVFEGASFVLRTPLLRRVSGAALLFGFFFPILLASVPVVVQERFTADASIAGFLYAAWGAGAVIGAFGVTRLAEKVPPMRMGALAAVALALPLWLLALPLSSWQFGLVLLVSGIFTPMLNAPLITLILLRTPEHIRAKAITFVMTANLIAGPAGYALAGPLLERIGLTAVLAIAAGGVTLAALVLVTLIGVRTEEEPAPPPTYEGEPATV